MVTVPERMDAKRWKDRSHEHKGPCGIDMFFGQVYTAQQQSRIIALYANEPFDFDTSPRWVRQLVWFLGIKPIGEFAADGDFGWQTRMEGSYHRMFLKSKSILEDIDFVSGDVSYPFNMAMDN
jgi:hypothetical protein